MPAPSSSSSSFLLFLIIITAATIEEVSHCEEKAEIAQFVAEAVSAVAI